MCTKRAYFSKYRYTGLEPQTWLRFKAAAKAEVELASQARDYKGQALF